MWYLRKCTIRDTESILSRLSYPAGKIVLLQERGSCGIFRASDPRFAPLSVRSNSSVISFPGCENNTAVEHIHHCPGFGNIPDSHCQPPALIVLVLTEVCTGRVRALGILEITFESILVHGIPSLCVWIHLCVCESISVHGISSLCIWNHPCTSGSGTSLLAENNGLRSVTPSLLLSVQTAAPLRVVWVHLHYS